MAFNPLDHMLDLKGKAYLQVMWRLVWFREDHPDWSIRTDLITHDKDAQMAVFRAEIIDPKTETVLSSGYGSETVRDFKDYLEKAETKAVGRALAMLGYGTQFAPDLDEGERIVDSPVTSTNTRAAQPKKKKKIDETAAIELAGTMIEKGIKPEFACKLYGVQNLSEMTEAQFDNAINNLDKILDRQKTEEKEKKK